MITGEENHQLTEVGPGTMMGDLLRRYWHPVAAASQLDQEPVLPVELLGEKLVLFRDNSGALGLLARGCAHRQTSLVYGMPEESGLRCAYHGWVWDSEGRCIEQPSEPADSTFWQKITTRPIRSRSSEDSSSATWDLLPRRCCPATTSLSGTTRAARPTARSSRATGFR